MAERVIDRSARAPCMKLDRHVQLVSVRRIGGEDGALEYKQLGERHHHDDLF